MLKDLQCITGGGRYLFPPGGKGFTTPNRLTYAMRDMNLGRGTTPHCWRTTFSTWANENGYRPDAIERQLAHVESNKGAGDVQRRCCWIRRTLSQDWADYLRCCGGQRHSIENGFGRVSRQRVGRAAFSRWIGPLSLECRSLAVCLCRRLGLK